MAMRDVQELVGRRVKVDLGADGVYVGELLELTGSMWQGRVRVTGVLAPAQHLVPGGALRRGYRPGEFIDAGEARLAPTAEPGHETYLAALQAAASRQLGSHSGYQTSPHGWVNEALARALRTAHLAEEHRLATGNWRVVPDDSLAPA
jgi:hypothetical protein